jgi:ubiquinone/menaquinone biosynthesis C-methylase UbiE
MTKLHIGCGTKRLAGFINIDESKNVKPDIVASITKLPFKDGSVDEIYSAHTLEHIQDFRKAMREMHRVLKKGGKLVLVLPYPTSMATFVPHHYWYFSWDALAPFVKGSGWAYYENFHFTSQKQQLIFGNWFYRLFAGFANAHPALYQTTAFCHLIPAVEIKIEMIK